MTVPNLLEHWFWNSLRVTLETALPTLRVQIPGMREPVKDDVLRWVALSPLSMATGSSRRGTWSGGGLFQCSCFARFADMDPTLSINEPWKLCGEVRPVLSGVDIPVIDYDNVEAVVACATLNTAFDPVYLPETTVGASSSDVAIALVNVHAVALTMRFSLVAE